MRNFLRLAGVLAGALVLSSCADTQNITSQITGSASRISNKLYTDWTGGAFRKGPLHNVMQSSSTDWPRAAVTINKMPKRAYQHWIGAGMAQADDCINISVTLWRDPTTSQRYDNIDFCSADWARDYANTNSGSYMLWADMPDRGRNTGGNRTQGPNPPLYTVPQGNNYKAFSGSFGMVFWNELTNAMGYDLGQEGNDHRMWIVNMPTEADLNKNLINSFLGPK